MSQRVEAVIFDLDGLLVDSEPLQIAAWRAYLNGLGAELTAEVLERMYGLRLSDAAEVVVRLLELDISSEQVAIERDALFLSSVPGNIQPCRGAIDLVTELNHRGMPIALATSGHRRYVDLALESAGIPKVFDAEVTGEMVVRGKPDPETFLTAAGLLGIKPTGCLVLEDSPNGARAAKAAGMHCLAIPNVDTNSLDLSVADEILLGLDRVLEWIDS
jgi:HAD superfamily hydrolase (TIGR01509 family)